MNFEIGKYYTVTGSDGNSWIIQLKSMPEVSIYKAGTINDDFHIEHPNIMCSMQTVREATKEEEEWLNSKK